MRQVFVAASSLLCLLGLTACTGNTTLPVTVTPTVTVSVSPSAQPSATASTTPTSAPSASASPDPAVEVATRQCRDSTLTVTMNSDPGEAGTLRATVVFTNTGTSSCVLEGAPGVSVVGDHNGTQIGVPAARDQSEAHDVTLAANGGTAHALLAIADLRHGTLYAPKGCAVVPADGYRIYPPHSMRAYYVAGKPDETYACRGNQVFLHVSVVSAGK